MSVPAAYLGVILIWSTTPLAVKWSSEGAGFLFGSAARMLLGTVFCLIVLTVLRTRVPWHTAARRVYFASSIGIYGAMLCVYWGAQFIPSGLISVLFGLTPLVTAIMSAVFLQERSISTAKMFGIVLGIAGLVIIFRSELVLQHNAVYGIAAVLVSVLLHSTSTVLVKRHNAGLPAMVVNAGGLLVSSAMYLLTWLLFDRQVPSHMSLQASVSIVYLSLFGTVLGFSLYFYALRHLQANHIGLIPLITPVSALLLGQTFNGEHITAAIWTGTGLIMTGLILHQWHGGLLRRTVAAP